MASLQEYKNEKYERLNGELVLDISHSAETRYTIFWDNNNLWLEAHLYLLRKHGKRATISSNAKDILDYAKWLEDNDVDWLTFPRRKADRCLYRYKGYLVNESNISQSLKSRRMNAVVNFYKWMKVVGLVDKRLETWGDQQVAITFFDKVGFERTTNVWTTDLRIPNRRKNISTLEEGLLPISAADRDSLLGYLYRSERERDKVLYLMFLVGFFVGARIGSIKALRIEHLRSAQNDKVYPGVKQVVAGPGTSIPTKFDVSGYLRFPELVIEKLIDYACKDIGRLHRQTKADEKLRSLVFLTKSGKEYSQQDINNAMSGLRKDLIHSGRSQFHGLKFHQSRATCGTELAKLFMEDGDHKAIQHVRDWLMHKHESTTWKYIHFLKNTKQAEKLNHEFNRIFLGEGFCKWEPK